MLAHVEQSQNLNSGCKFWFPHPTEVEVFVTRGFFPLVFVAMSLSLLHRKGAGLMITVFVLFLLLSVV